ncbi:hypothetical protein AKUH3B101J_09160 [Apilactobacillus kunkeei]|nr:hypothetical protein AKUH3B104J_09160 [Apilactobacillus kunkeei]CAI2616858.1 hypothetical protein AKUH3B101J_09160 [Apilactobacillus kunkeei]
MGNKSDIVNNLKKQKDEEESNLNELNKNRQKINIIYKSIKKNKGKNSSNYKTKNQFSSDANEIKNIETTNSISETFQRQIIDIRDSYHGAIQESIKFQSSLRKKLSIFFIVYISIVTIVILLIIVDPIALIRNVTSYYSNEVKLMLLGAFFANIISVLVIMVKYSFEPSDKFIEAINKIGHQENEKK